MSLSWCKPCQRLQSVSFTARINSQYRYITIRSTRNDNIFLIFDNHLDNINQIEHYA